MQAQRFSIAPMLDWTDRHCRYFHRLMTRQTLLYTEMVTTGAIIHGKGDYLGYSEQEHPLALQLGGSNPADLARCAKLAEERGYDEINLNVGCPSDRVQNGRFGACLMGEPALVADCVKAMRDVVKIPVTVKTRIGIDEHVSWATRLVFQVGRLLVGVTDGVVGLVVPGFSLSRLFTRAVGYHLLTRFLMNQTRPLALPDRVAY